MSIWEQGHTDDPLTFPGPFLGTRKIGKLAARLEQKEEAGAYFR
jgi:hypothetical protein